MLQIFRDRFIPPFKQWLMVSFLVGLVTLTSCSVSPTSGLKSYVDEYDGYQFLYPNGWVEIDSSRVAPDVIFHDLIESSENVSVVINPVEGNKTLEDLGSAAEVGNTLAKTAIAPPDSGRSADLLSAFARTDDQNKAYYLFEYFVKLPDNTERHNVASVSISRGQLFTLNISVPERVWSQIGDKMKVMAQSFSVY